MELMFAAKTNHPTPAFEAAAARLFETLNGAMPAIPTAPGVPIGPGGSPAELRTRFKLLPASDLGTGLLQLPSHTR